MFSSRILLTLPVTLWLVAGIAAAQSNPTPATRDGSGQPSASDTSSTRGSATEVATTRGIPVEDTTPVPQGWSNGRYRVTPTDVLELTFPSVTEFNQVVSVQPDGYVTLKAVGDVRVQGRTLPELGALVREAYEPILRDPLVTIVLKEFEKPYFVAAGEVKTPGKFELRGATTVTQALAVAGGFTDKAKVSQVVLFRRYSEDLMEVKEINVKKMFSSRKLEEDYVLRPGDTVWVPRTMISKLAPYLPTAGFGIYLNPFN
jgi:polysaccharide export outer membrane protein